MRMFLIIGTNQRSRPGDGPAGAGQPERAPLPAPDGGTAVYAAAAASGVRWLTFGSTSFISSPIEVRQASGLSA